MELNKKYIILGIDPSLTSTGLIVFSSTGEILLRESVKTKLLRGMERLKFIKEKLLQVLKDYKIDKVCIESYAFGVVKSRSKFDLGELGGVIRLTLFEQGIEYLDIAPPTLKKYVTGYGNADKVMMVEAILNRWKIDFANNIDEADAYGLAKMGHDVFNLKLDIAEIIKKMTKEKTVYL